MHSEYKLKLPKIFKFSHFLLLYYELLTNWNETIFIMHANPQYCHHLSFACYTQRLSCNTIINIKKRKFKEECASCSNCKRCKEWFSFGKTKYNPPSWYSCKTHEELKNLIFDRAMLCLKKLIYNIMPKSD